MPFHRIIATDMPWLGHRSFRRMLWASVCNLHAEGPFCSWSVFGLLPERCPRCAPQFYGQSCLLLRLLLYTVWLNCGESACWTRRLYLSYASSLLVPCVTAVTHLVISRSRGFSGQTISSTGSYGALFQRIVIVVVLGTCCDMTHCSAGHESCCQLY